MKIKREKSILKQKRGSSVVEFALILPILLTLVFGIVDFSRLFYYKAILSSCNKEAARIVSLGKSINDIDNLMLRFAKTLSPNVAAVNSKGVDDEGNPCTKIVVSDSVKEVMTAYITPEYLNTIKSGDTIRIWMSCKVEFITPLKVVYESSITLKNQYYCIIETPPS